MERNERKIVSFQKKKKKFSRFQLFKSPSPSSSLFLHPLINTDYYTRESRLLRFSPNLLPLDKSPSKMDSLVHTLGGGGQACTHAFVFTTEKRDLQLVAEQLQIRKAPGGRGAWLVRRWRRKRGQPGVSALTSATPRFFCHCSVPVHLHTLRNAHRRPRLP